MCESAGRHPAILRASERDYGLPPLPLPIQHRPHVFLDIKAGSKPLGVLRHLGVPVHGALISGFNTMYRCAKSAEDNPVGQSLMCCEVTNSGITLRVRLFDGSAPAHLGNGRRNE